MRKKQNPSRFFSGWLDTHNLSFADVMLIDDKSTNCDAFHAHGGTPLRWDSHHDTVAHLHRALSHWIAAQPATRTRGQSGPPR